MSVNDIPVKLPPFTTEVQLLKARGNNTDWSHNYYKIKELHAKNKKGKGVRVAVLDTGIDLSHDSFDKAKAEGRLLAFDARRNNNNPIDNNGHGSWVCSRYISDGDDVLGFSPDLELLSSYKVLGDGGGGSLSDVIYGANRAIDDGHHIISTSLGWSRNVPQFKAVIDKAERNNVLWISASGNDGRLEDIDYPALYGYVISCGSHNKLGKRSRFSDFGVDLDVYSSGEGVLGAYTRNREAYLNGTSMATPSFGALLATIYFDIINKYGEINREVLKKIVECH